jgi:two-component sensor histidine kinase
VSVTDEGAGFPEGFAVADSPRLGLRIVETLVAEELRGRLVLGRQRGRTEVRLDLAAG